jgi:putative peptidoglycan binding protein
MGECSQFSFFVNNGVRLNGNSSLVRKGFASLDNKFKENADMKITIAISSILTALILTGCASDPNSKLADIQNELDQAQAKNEQLQNAYDQTSQDLQRLADANKRMELASAASASSSSDMLPPNAKPGECYARVLIPATYRTETKDVVKSEASYRLNVTEPQYEWVNERVLVKEESEVAETIPAKYDWRTESVLVKEAHEHLKTIPAVYETKTEKILVKPAYTTWKKGHGPIERVDNSTGEIMCLVEVPAEYKTVSTRVLVTPARTEKVTHPAEYKEVKKRVMVEGPKMVKRTIPAEYKTVKVRKVAVPAQEQRIEIPAKYQTVTNKVKVTDSYMQWRTILCETNTTHDVVRRIQRALQSAGHNPGDIDGIIGNDTIEAVKSYQRAKRLAVGQITTETLKSLGVSY